MIEELVDLFSFPVLLDIRNSIRSIDKKTSP